MRAGTTPLELIRVDPGGAVDAHRLGIGGQMLNRGTLDVHELAIDEDGRLELEAGVLRVHHVGAHGDMDGLITGHGTIDASGIVNNTGTLAPAGGTMLLVSTAGTGVWNLGGNDGTGNVAVISGDLTVLGEHLTFDGSMSIGPDRTVAIDSAAWRLGTDGTLLFLGGVSDPATFAGHAGAGHARIEGEVAVSTIGIFDIPVTFESAARVELSSAHARLSLAQSTTYRGGSYTGDGIIEQLGDATVEQDTLVDVGTADVAPFVQLLVSGGSTSVPEPGVMTLLGLASLLLLRRRVSRHWR